MSDPSQSYDQKTEYHHRGRSFHPSNRPIYRGRGRGRGDGRGQVQRTLNVLGVTDLREHLDRKHLHDQSKSSPPSDPSYNYLSDPLREIVEQHSKANTSVQRSNSHRGRGRFKQQDPIFIQNPTNIQVQLSTSTGQRNYSINEESKLADIRHVPDYNYSQYQDSRGRGNYIRGRGLRVRGRGKYFTNPPIQEHRVRAKSTDRQRTEERGSHIRSKSVEYREKGDEWEHRGKALSNFLDLDKGESSLEDQKGKFSDGEFRGRFRGRGRWRGRGRGRGRGNQKLTSISIEALPPNFELSAEDWNEPQLDTTKDKQECVIYEELDKNKLEDRESNEQETKNNQEDCNETEGPTLKELQPSYEGENIVVTSEIGDSKKRIVRFNLTEDTMEKKGEVLESKKP